MIPMSNSHTEIEESLLPDIAVADRAATKRRRVYICIIVSFLLVVACGVLTGVLYVVLRSRPIPALVTPTVILISLDGFRWDYLDMYKAQTPVLNKLRAEGTYSAIEPRFVTKTFPNHYSIVTGLYPESHGIVANTFYDPTFNQTFTISSSAVLEAKWWGGEPLWVTAQKSGLKSGVYYWPGSEAPIMGVYPTYYKQYNINTPMNERVAGVIQWLNMSEGERPNFLALYMEPVDSMGHDYGPNSTQVADAAQTIDTALGELVDYLSSSHLFNSTNIIILADHGMTQLSQSRVVYIEECVDLTKIRIVDYSPNCYIIPNNPADTAEIMQNLTSCRVMYPNITAYLRQDIPINYVYNNNSRITPILVISDLGWTITTRARPLNYWGNHGYDNRQPDMRGLFLAHGANIKPGVQLDLVPNLDIYNFITHILKINGASNNGTSNLIDSLAM